MMMGFRYLKYLTKTPAATAAKIETKAETLLIRVADRVLSFAATYTGKVPELSR